MIGLLLEDDHNVLVLPNLEQVLYFWYDKQRKVLTVQFQGETLKLHDNFAEEFLAFLQKREEN